VVPSRCKDTPPSSSPTARQISWPAISPERSPIADCRQRHDVRGVAPVCTPIHPHPHPPQSLSPFAVLVPSSGSVGRSGIAAGVLWTASRCFLPLLIGGGGPHAGLITVSWVPRHSALSRRRISVGERGLTRAADVCDIALCRPESLEMAKPGGVRGVHGSRRSGAMGGGKTRRCHPTPACPSAGWVCQPWRWPAAPPSLHCL